MLGGIVVFLKYKYKYSQGGLAVVIMLHGEGEAPRAEGVTEPSGGAAPIWHCCFCCLGCLHTLPHILENFAAVTFEQLGTFLTKYLFGFLFLFRLYFYLFYESQEANTNTNTSRGLLIALGLTHRLFSGS